MRSEILYGVHAVREALAAGRREVYEAGVDRRHAAAGRLKALLSALAERGVAVRTMDGAQLAAWAGSPAHQGVAARVSPFREADPGAVFGAAGRPEAETVLALDQVEDPHNLGALLRTALCAGVAAVVVPKDRSAPPTPAVSRVSAGALEHIRLVRVTNLVRTLEALKEAGRWVVGLDRSADASLFAADLRLPIVLTVGGEGRGMRPLVRRACDLLLSIPQAGPLDSLNVSVAAGIALFEIRRQRGAGAPPGGV